MTQSCPYEKERAADIVHMGESAKDLDFLRVLQDALWEIPSEKASTFGHHPLTGKLVEPEVVAVNRVAELAKRTMLASDDCSERVYCDWWRRRVSQAFELTSKLHCCNACSCIRAVHEGHSLMISHCLKVERDLLSAQLAAPYGGTAIAEMEHNTVQCSLCCQTHSTHYSDAEE